MLLISLTVRVIYYENTLYQDPKIKTNPYNKQMSSALFTLKPQKDCCNIINAAKAASLQINQPQDNQVDVYSLNNPEAVSRFVMTVAESHKEDIESIEKLPIKMACRLKSNMLRPHTIKPRAVGVPYFNMSQVKSIYNIPNSVAPVTVAVVSFGGGLYGSVDQNGVLTNGDVQAYWSAIGIPQASHPKVIIKTLMGAMNLPNINDGGSTMENTLDVETLGGACPSANLTIIMYLSPNNLSAFAPMLNAIRTTPVVIGNVTYTPTIVSCSWGAPEIYYGSTLLNSMNQALKALTDNNVNFTAATGDNGSNNGVGGSANYVDFPSSSPYATAVGGTTLYCPNNVYDSFTTETAWTFGGGGISSLNPKPSYQSAIPGAGRSSPDVAAIADPNTGVVFLINGQYEIIGGTSVASPVIAGFLAAINCQIFINPKLYNQTSQEIATSYHDVRSGTNGGFSAGSGYDNCTGWGSINGVNLSAILGNILVTGISLSPNQVVLNIGQTSQLTATVTPSIAVNKAVIWSSSNTQIATVSSSGLVAALTAGTVTVTATAADGSNVAGTAAITVQGSGNIIPVTNLTLAQTSGTLHPGDTVQLVPVIAPPDATDKTVIWSTSNASRATVSTSGLVTVNANYGMVTISAVSNNNRTKTATYTLNVTVPVTGITLSALSLNLVPNQNRTVVATVRPNNAGNKAVRWSSSNNQVATVNLNGTITGRGNGTAIITATTQDMGLTATVTVTVTTPVQGVIFNQSIVSINVGSTFQARATLIPITATNQNVTWFSSSNAIATVSQSGLITGIRNGTAIVSVVTQDGNRRANMTVRVTTPATSVTVTPATVRLPKGQSTRLIPIVQPPNASNTAVTWSSNNVGVATVTTRGVVRATNTAGTATITATTSDGGFTSSCEVTVF